MMRRRLMPQVNFLPLDIRDEEDIALVLHHADYIVQYGEDLEPKQPKDDDVSAKYYGVPGR